MKKSTMKILGLGASIIGFGLTMVCNWLNDRERDQIIEEKVTKALATIMNKES